MKRLLFAVLMMVCSVSWAEWVITGRTNKDTYYHDKSSIRRNGSVVKMWTMTNYGSVQTSAGGYRHKSAKDFLIFNCRDETIEIISSSIYSGSMGTGSVVWSGTRQESDRVFRPIVPDSFSEIHWQIACGKE
jgi:hypothetical protein